MKNNEASRQIGRAALQLTVAISTSAVTAVLVAPFMPLGMNRIQKFTWSVGEWAINSLVTQIASEYIGEVYDALVENDPESHIFPNLIIKT